MNGQILVEQLDHVVQLTIDNSARANALTPELAHELTKALSVVKHDNSVRVVSIRGSGTRVFCSGFDLNQIGTDTTSTGMPELMSAIGSCVVPVVAIVNGHAIGGGFEIACRCDLRVARVGLQVGLPTVRLGVGGRADALSAMVRVTPTARRMILTGQQLPVETALGFADVLVPASKLEAAAADLLSDIAAAAPLAVSYSLRVLRCLQRGDGQGGDEWERERAELSIGPDVMEAKIARTEGRAPQFLNRQAINGEWDNFDE
jgi:enoyl-CoA hydratase/carnithine racemase